MRALRVSPGELQDEFPDHYSDLCLSPTGSLAGPHVALQRVIDAQSRPLTASIWVCVTVEDTFRSGSNELMSRIQQKL